MCAHMAERPPDPDFPDQPPLGPPAPPVPPGAIRPPLPWGEPTPAAAPGPNRTPLLVAVALLAVVALVVGSVLAFRAAGDDDPDEVASPTPTTEEEQEDEEPATTTTATTAPEVVVAPEDVIAEIQAFVEAERGLPFLEDPVVEIADEDEFEARLLEDFEEDTDDLVAAGHTLEALGLLEPGTDIVATMRDLLDVGVVGFYRSETRELVVRGGALTPYVRTVIAHELTHALDDQHFGIDRPEIDESEDERSFGFTGLVEGSASHVEQAYRATFTPAEESEATDEELRIGSDPRFFDLPFPLIESLQAPYMLGPDLVQALLDDGGRNSLDGAFAVPPTSSEQLLDPDRYLEGDLPQTLPFPAADGEVVDRGVIGALGLAQMFGVGPLLGFGATDPAVEGWGGDAYVTWLDPTGRACLRATLVGDTVEDTDELRVALLRWTDDPPLFGFPVDATIEGGELGNPVTLTSCATA